MFSPPLFHPPLPLSEKRRYMKKNAESSRETLEKTKGKTLPNHEVQANFPERFSFYRRLCVPTYGLAIRNANGGDSRESIKGRKPTPKTRKSLGKLFA